MKLTNKEREKVLRLKDDLVCSKVYGQIIEAAQTAIIEEGLVSRKKLTRKDKKVREKEWKRLDKITSLVLP